MNFFKFLFLLFLIPCISENLNAQTNDVTLKWDDNRTVLIHIGEASFPMQAGGERVISLPVDDALIIKVETPQSSYTAESFLLIDDRNNAALTIWLNGSEVQFEYGTEGELNRNSPPSTPVVAEDRNNRSENLQSNREARAQRNVVYSNMSLGLYETNPGVGLNLTASGFGYIGSVKEFRLDNSSIFHNLAIDLNASFYRLDDGPSTYSSTTYDFGLGYGAVFQDKILTTATINIPIWVYSWAVIRLNNSVESMNESQYFVTDAAYLRLHGSWSPFIDSGGWFRGLSFNASWDAALSGNGGSRFNIGIGISDFILR